MVRASSAVRSASTIFWHYVGQTPCSSLLSDIFTNLKLTDMETCYKVFRREVLQGIQLKSNRFGFEPRNHAPRSQKGSGASTKFLSPTRRRTLRRRQKISLERRPPGALVHHSATASPIEFFVVPGLQAQVLCFCSGGSSNPFFCRCRGRRLGHGHLWSAAARLPRLLLFWLRRQTISAMPV